MVLGKLPVPELPTNLDNIWARPTALGVGAVGGCFGHFFSCLSFLFPTSLSGRRPSID